MDDSIAKCLISSCSQQAAGQFDEPTNFEQEEEDNGR